MNKKLSNNSAWNYFQRSADGKSGKCTIGKCTTEIQAKGGSTSGLHNHLRSQHQINLQKRVDSSESSATVSNIKPPAEKITSYFSKTADDSFNVIVSRMVALDGIPFKSFITSNDLRSLLANKGYDVPKSAHTIRDIVLKYAENVRASVTKELTGKIAQGKRLSLTFDECTSLRNRRYMNINIHDALQFYNIGLSRVFGSMPAEKCIELLEKKLSQFGIQINQTVGITTDGAAVMVKVGRLLEVEHQLCMAHGIQLAVVDVLYKKFQKASSDDNLEDGDVADSDDEYDNDDKSDAFELTTGNDDDDYELKTDIQILVSKIRKVVNLFRRSPTQNDSVLQKYVQEEFGKNLTLIKDTRTRWNSLYDMLDRFQDLKNCVRKGLIDINSDIQFSDNEILLVSEITSALLPIKLAVEKLCSLDINLHTADIILKFTLDELASQNTFLSNALKTTLIDRIQQRRNNNSNIIQYLYNPNNQATGEDYGIFNKKQNKIEMAKAVAKLIKRLTDHEVDADDIDIGVAEPSNLDRSSLTLKERLNLTIQEKKAVPLMEQKENNSKDLIRVIKREMDYFEAANVRGKYLERAFEYLNTMQPTSVESERAFSAAGLLCSKIRSRMNDETLDALSFLRAHFQKSKI